MVAQNEKVSLIAIIRMVDCFDFRKAIQRDNENQSWAAGSHFKNAYWTLVCVSENENIRRPLMFLEQYTDACMCMCVSTQ
jgi:hypothetical protein